MEEYQIALIFLKDGNLEISGITKEQIALSLINQKKIQLRMRSKVGRSEIIQVTIDHALYFSLLNLMELPDKVNFVKEDLVDTYQNCYIEVLALVVGGKPVRIKIRLADLASISDSLENEEEFQVDFIADIFLSENIKFEDLWVPLEVAILLEGRQGLAVYWS